MKAFIGTMMAVCLALPAMARVEDYGPRRFTQVGRGHGGHGVVIDRRGGPGWAGVLAGGLIGAAAGLALGGALQPGYVAPAPVYVGPPAIGTVVPALPPGCVDVPNYYNGAVYNCGNIYYQPFYEGPSLMYEVVPAP